MDGWRQSRWMRRCKSDELMQFFYYSIKYSQYLSTLILIANSHNQQQLIIIMRIYTRNIRQLISSKKFYDIANERKDMNLPKTSQQLIISKYLKENSPYASRDITDAINSDRQANLNSNNKVMNYQNFIRESPNGSIIEQEYKNVHLSMASLNYQNINIKDIFKICEKFNPDLILVQARPETYIKDYQLLPKVNNVFSDHKYLDQLCLKTQALANNILNPALSDRLQAILEKKSISSQKVFIKDNRDLVEDDVVMMASYFASTNQATLVFGELPQQPWREWFCNSHTLMELVEIFKHICKNIPFYESLKLSPYRLGALLKPEIFLNMRDRYMATLIEMAIATKKYNKILCIMGLAENQAIQQILLNESLLRQNDNSWTFTPIIEYLIGPEIKHSLLRNIEGWEIIEKHILLDVLQFGEAVIDEPLEVFTTTNKVIDHYGRALNDYPQEKLMKFRYDKTLGYLSLMRSQIVEGKELKKKFMLRQAMRSADV